ncbi:MAG TPA: hypothetical protein VLR91_01565 [Thermodesulfobacteriota bacterium]|nr:hypothetical protein [Thermodesulfobacteriota bacterium]
MAREYGLPCVTGISGATDLSTPARRSPWTAIWASSSWGKGRGLAGDFL